MARRVLFSGGMDSTLCLIMAQREDASVEAVAVDYGQRHARQELAQAVLIAQTLAIPLHILRGVDVGDGALTCGVGELDSASAVLPGRNKALLRAAGWLHGLRASELVIGATLDDAPHFEDCRPEFFEALSVEWGIRIEAPLVAMTKADVVCAFAAWGASSTLVYTYSCYRGAELACGFCGACRARVRGFSEAGVRDPGAYADRRLLTSCGFCGAGPGDRCHHPNHGYTAPHSQRVGG